MNRASALEGVLFWSASFAFKAMVITSPMVYWLTGTIVINGDVNDMLTVLGPYIACSLVFNSFLAGNAILPFMTDVTQLLSAMVVIRSVAVGLVKPWGHPFKVTSKGVSMESVTVQWRILAPFAVVAIITAVASMLFHWSPFLLGNGTAVAMV